MRKRTVPDADLVTPAISPARLAQFILHRLEQLEMTQVQLAAAIGRSATYVNKVIHGRTGFSVDTATRMEQVLGCSAGSLTVLLAKRLGLPGQRAGR